MVQDARRGPSRCEYSAVIFCNHFTLRHNDCFPHKPPQLMTWMEFIARLCNDPYISCGPQSGGISLTMILWLFSVPHHLPSKVIHHIEPNTYYYFLLLTDID